ncbi:hypothetical protein L873DRAFT_1801404 [Choiromyces venosus 120613-1]|uniref:Uncharacterized protein n=1 Tax=Choiromyces venosus 120613-1 TaxID=1336337 RepID=A0A3N4KA97_9PEZI|nr:hypothetical protein L873DRAFT_1801404 [Choiromyces venosus 120613-1]
MSTSPPPHYLDYRCYGSKNCSTRTHSPQLPNPKLAYPTKSAFYPAIARSGSRQPLPFSGENLKPASITASRPSFRAIPGDLSEN